jgi:hypothetical protein
MMFLWGVLATLALGALLAVLFDQEIREAALSLGWALLIGLPVMLFLGVAWLARRLPERIRPRMVRGRKLSTKALQRAVLHADYFGWSISRPSVSIIVFRRKADS